MATYGYHRTSTRDQHLDRGIHEIQIFCKEHDLELENIFTDQQTGKNFNRPRYTVLVEEVLREGDILLVTELDRLGRNKWDTMERFQKITRSSIRENPDGEKRAIPSNMINCFCMYSDYTPLTLDEWILCDRKRREKLCAEDSMEMGRQPKRLNG